VSQIRLQTTSTTSTGLIGYRMLRARHVRLMRSFSSLLHTVLTRADDLLRAFPRYFRLFGLNVSFSLPELFSYPP
jgi:hypothetical protein